MDGRFKKFSQILKSERLTKGLTQLQMAQKLGIKQPIYNRYEKGGSIQGREPDFDMLCKIAIVLGVSTDYLLGMEE